MVVEKKANGTIQLVLTPETAIERIFLAEMTERASKGQVVTLSGDSECMTVAVEQ
jgi:hypothetical protein